VTNARSYRTRVRLDWAYMFMRCNECKTVAEVRMGANVDHTHTQMHIRKCKQCGIETVHTIVPLADS
jgi:RNase P subunit RPR2